MQRGHQIGLHVRVGIFLDDERRRGVAQIKQQHAVARPALLDKVPDFACDLGKALARRVDDELRARQQLRRDMRIADSRPGTARDSVSSCAEYPAAGRPSDRPAGARILHEREGAVEIDLARLLWAPWRT